MSKFMISLGIGLAAGFSLAFLSLDPGTKSVEGLTANNAVARVEYECDLQAARKLERALQEERQASNLLQVEIDRLRSDVERMTALESAIKSSDDEDWLANAWADLAISDKPADRQQMLTDAGFAPTRAGWILQRVSELQMAAVEERYRNPEGNGLFDYLDSRVAGREALRDEIGDYEYEQYLAATAQSTTVAITQVMADSPAQDAGFQVGDQIVDYDGIRVFNMIELVEQARDGVPSEAVVVNIRRDGAPMQLVLPRGPLGISGGKPIRH